MLKIQTNIVRKLAGVCGLLILAHAANAQFTFPVYEPFSEYAEDEELGTNGSSGNVWSAGSSTSASSSLITAAAALSYPGLPADPGSTPRGLRSTTTATSVKYRHAPFTSQSSGTVYCSFLLEVTNVSMVTANTIIFSLSSSGSSSSGHAASCAAQSLKPVAIGKKHRHHLGTINALYLGRHQHPCLGFE